MLTSFFLSFFSLIFRVIAVHCAARPIPLFEIKKEDFGIYFVCVTRAASASCIPATIQEQWRSGPQDPLPPGKHRTTALLSRLSASYVKDGNASLINI